MWPWEDMAEVVWETRSLKERKLRKWEIRVLEGPQGGHKITKIRTISLGEDDSEPGTKSSRNEVGISDVGISRWLQQGRTCFYFQDKKLFYNYNNY